LGLTGCIETVILSCVVGIRKPDPAILLTATGKMGVKPERCVYVGDSPDRDVAGARAAGFARTVIIRNQRKPDKLSQHPTLIPDHIIDNLNELLELFPVRPIHNGYPGGTGSPVYDASISTMWAKNNFPTLNDFFLAAGKLGFAKVELNHQMNSEMLSEVDLGKYSISSVHEPCPADVSMETLKARDWLISSIDEECRQKGVTAVKRSIELAGKLSVRTLVVHSGHVSPDLTLEKKLRKLFNAGQTESSEYQELKSQMMEKRHSLAGPALQAVEKSIKELLEFAARFDVRLGLENRYHYYDLPSQDEMAVLLALAEPDQVGFIYDVGHATAMDRLGFYPSEMWLKRFSKRIYGTHLHDVIGLMDHNAPGLGDVDFRMVASYLPKDAFRTLELLISNTPEQIKAGMQILVDTGCVNEINK
jgi:sugar phosphate isomerase/epimerase